MQTLFISSCGGCGIKVLAGTDDKYDPTKDATYDEATRTFVCNICYHGMYSDIPVLSVPKAVA